MDDRGAARRHQLLPAAAEHVQGPFLEPCLADGLLKQLRVRVGTTPFICGPVVDSCRR